MKCLLLVLYAILLTFTEVGAQSIAFDRLDNLNKGCNFSNWLEAYWLNDSDYPQNDQYSFEDVQGMEDAGMSGIRLNVNFERFLDQNAPYALDLNHPAMQYIDSVILWADSLNMMVVLVNQHGWDNLNDFTYGTIKPRLTALWDQLTNKYKTVDPELLLLEIMNEPPFLLSRSKTRVLMQDMLAVIRNHTIDHTVIVSSNYYSAGNDLSATIPIEGDNIIYTFHFYEPYWFTHQGASWTDIPYPINTPFPHPILSAEANMRSIFSKVSNWRERYNIPVYLGELGTINYGSEESKCNWITLLGELIDEYDMPWTYWDCKYTYDDRFGFYEDSEINIHNVKVCYAEALRLYDFSPPTFNYNKEVNSFDLYPNPAQNQIQFNFNDTYFNSAKIVGLFGQEQYEMDIDFIADTTPTVIIDHLPPGVYAVMLYKYSEIIAVGKFVKI